MNKQNFTYLTVLSSNDYLLGVLALFYSFLQTKSLYPFYVMLTSSVSKDIEDKLLDSGIRCIRVCNHISLDDDKKSINNRSNFSHWNNTLDKLLMFDLVQFDKGNL